MYLSHQEREGEREKYTHVRMCVRNKFLYSCIRTKNQRLYNQSYSGILLVAINNIQQSDRDSKVTFFSASQEIE